MFLFVHNFTLSFPPYSEVIECKEPIEVVSYKIGVCKVSPKGKDCLTTFEKLGFNGKTSVVLCKPRTGRMHQIRVHLQYLGELLLIVCITRIFESVKNSFRVELLVEV